MTGTITRNVSRPAEPSNAGVSRASESPAYPVLTRLLTRRETMAVEVLALFRRGLDTMQIAAELWITEAQCVEFLYAERERRRVRDG